MKYKIKIKFITFQWKSVSFHILNFNYRDVSAKNLLWWYNGSIYK